MTFTVFCSKQRAKSSREHEITALAAPAPYIPCPNRGLRAQRRLETAGSAGLCIRLGKEAQPGFVCSSQPSRTPSWGESPVGLELVACVGMQSTEQMHQ